MAELYSVWAPAPPAHPSLLQAQQHLRKLFGGPDFETHVTVLADVAQPLDAAVAMLQKLARSLAPITYRIRGVGNGSTYFQSIFLVVDPTAEVVDAHRQARQVFEMEESGNTAYFPHVSLLYGDLKDDTKQEAKAIAEKEFGNSLINSEFVVSSLTLWATDTEDKLLTTWKKVAEFPLQGSR